MCLAWLCEMCLLAGCGSSREEQSVHMDSKAPLEPQMNNVEGEVVVYFQALFIQCLLLPVAIAPI